MIPYSMLISWSEEDQLFLVSFPELTGADIYQTHGATYEEAARQGRDALESLIDAFREWNIPRPDPSLCHFTQEPATSNAG